MKVIKAGIGYQLADGNLTKLVFRHYDERLKVTVDGVRHEDLLEVLIDRFMELNKGEGYCIENVVTLNGLRSALNEQNARSVRRRLEKTPMPDVPTHFESIGMKTLGELSEQELDHLSLGLTHSFGLQIGRESGLYIVNEGDRDVLAFRNFSSVACVWYSCQLRQENEVTP
jgi:hypothetical protein